MNNLKDEIKEACTSVVTQSNKTSGCCGGAPVSNENSCCQLDEEKKAKGESGCGCNTTANSCCGTDAELKGGQRELRQPAGL
ncbi:MAG TPA: hypothetical protein VFI29_12150 [Hanamia sp.]|nr:hypothetical protein [Hanamia sp.]